MDCSCRDINCHSQCKAYKKYKDKLKKQKQVRDKDKIYFDYLRDKGR